MTCSLVGMDQALAYGAVDGGNSTLIGGLGISLVSLLDGQDHLLDLAAQV